MSHLRMTVEEFEKRQAKNKAANKVATKPISKPSKYRNIKTANGDSKKEVRRLRELELMVISGKIKNLQTQVKFELIPKQIRSDVLFERAASYIADFVYERQDGDKCTLVVEDVKSVFTKKLPVYILKRKLMLWVHNIVILET